MTTNTYMMQKKCDATIYVFCRSCKSGALGSLHGHDAAGGRKIKASIQATVQA